MASITSTGVGSGLDIESIVSKLMTAESAPLTALAKKEASYQAKLSAYGSLSSAVSSFQTAMANLGKSSTFDALKTSIGDSKILGATAASKAIAGNYQVNITQLAQAQNLSTAGQASKTATIGTGATTTISFQFGTISGGTIANGSYTGATFTQDADQATGSITIDGANNSLQGIRDAINAAGIGVTATIVSDGSSAPNKLVLTSTETGEASSMKISVDGDAALKGMFEYDPEGTQNLIQNNAAQDTKLTVNGLAISSATNKITDAIQGVTIDALTTGTTSLNITKDSSAVETNVNAFIKAYNELNTVVSNLTAYNATTKSAAPLVGDSTARSIQEQMRKMLNTSLEGMSNSNMSLSKIGVAFQKDGSLALDSTKLSKAITDNFSDISALFATVGKTTDSLVSFANSSTATKAGSYDIKVTRMATQATMTGTVNVGSSTTIAPNTTVTVTLDGITSKVYLTEGSYNAKDLAAMLQSSINGTTAFKSASSAVTAKIDDNGFLQITSDRYGSGSKLSIDSNQGTPISTYLGTTNAGTTGVDVAGTIGGFATTGSGQFLTGMAGTDVEGLKVEITGGTIGSRGRIDFSQGYADRLSKLAGTFIGDDGSITARTTGLNNTMKDIDKQQEAMQTKLTAIEKRYRAQFTALDVAVASMNSTSTYLTQQLELIKNQTA